jgi:hypothetical protein
MRTVLAVLLLSTGTVYAFDLELGLDGISEAVSLGRTSESRRADFHRPYRVIVNQAPLDYVDIVTPFRRVVLAAEARMLAGERMFGQRDALDTLGDRPEQVELRLELTFHPQNTFIGVPSYEVALTSIQTRQTTASRSTELVPRFGPRVNGRPTTSATQSVGITRGPTQPLQGGTIITTYDGRLLDRMGRYELSVKDAGKILAQATVNFAALR